MTNFHLDQAREVVRFNQLTIQLQQAQANVQALPPSQGHLSELKEINAKLESVISQLLS